MADRLTAVRRGRGASEGPGRSVRRDRARASAQPRLSAARRGGPARLGWRRPRYRLGRVLPRSPARPASQPAHPDAERTARAAERWTRIVIERLAGERFNVITLKWWGRPKDVQTFLERHGVRGLVHRGLTVPARTGPCGWPRTGPDAPETDDPAADLRVRLQLVRDRLGVGDTFVFSHLKATDAAGHTKDPAVKQRTIEVLDSELRDLPTERSIVCVTGDHATPAYPGGHPLGRPGSTRRGWAGSPGRSRRLVRRARLLPWDPRASPRPRSDAVALERGRPAALSSGRGPRRSRRRWSSGRARSADPVRAVEGRIPFRGFETWYRDVGQEAGVPLLCLHGGPGSTHSYFEPLEQLAAGGQQVVLYDQLGCGNSDRPRRPGALDTRALPRRGSDGSRRARP